MFILLLACILLSVNGLKYVNQKLNVIVQETVQLQETVNSTLLLGCLYLLYMLYSNLSVQLQETVHSTLLLGCLYLLYMLYSNVSRVFCC